MARLIPNIDPNTIDLKPERDVAIALVRDLADNCLIYHSYCWLNPDRDAIGNPLLEGEADFLILDPVYGLLVLEVKGGKIAHRIEGDTEVYFRKLRGGRERKINHPFKQASKNLHSIEDILKLKEGPPYWFGGCYGYAVVFPDCTLADRNTGRCVLPNDVDPHITFFAEHLGDMNRAVRGAFRKWNRLKSPSVSQAAMKQCREKLRPVFKLIHAPWRDIERNEEQLVKLTDQQQLVITGLRSNNRLAVRGGAGTGKTMLAFWQAIELAKSGEDVLFVCYNVKLAEWLRERLGFESDASIREKLKIYHFHGLCRFFYGKAKEPFSVPSDFEKRQAFWTDQVPDKMFDFIIDQLPDVRFDHVIIDEAQDFESNWWLVIESLLRDRNGPLSLFHDPNQNVYSRESGLPKTDAVFDLTVNCRNTRRIHEYSINFLDAEIASSKLVPEGEKPTVIKMPSQDQLKDVVATILKRLRLEYRLSCQKIAILSYLPKSRSPIADGDKLGGFEISEEQPKWRNGDGVLYSTIKTFKGLEADAVVLIGEGPDDYVATSRAKHLLFHIR